MTETTDDPRELSPALVNRDPFSRYLFDDPIGTLRRVAKQMREAAELAMLNASGDELCCWETEKIAGQERVIEVRRYEDGGMESRPVAVPLAGGIARHIAGMHPRVAVALADHLDAHADWLEGQPAVTAQFLPVGIARILHAYVVALHD